jgi:hypothetical protein
LCLISLIHTGLTHTRDDKDNNNNKHGRLPVRLGT